MLESQRESDDGPAGPGRDEDSEVMRMRLWNLQLQLELICSVLQLPFSGRECAYRAYLPMSPPCPALPKCACSSASSWG